MLRLIHVLREIVCIRLLEALRPSLVHLKAILKQHVDCVLVIRLNSYVQERVAILGAVLTESIHHMLRVNGNPLTHLEEKRIWK